MAQAFRPPEDPLEDLPEPQPDVQGAANTSLDCGSNVYEKQELLHRPHAFALMHGENGAKVAYGELHWAIDVLIANFKTTTISVNDHCDHKHEPHTTSNHQHTITSDTHDGHTHSDTATASYGKEGSGGNTGDIYTDAADSSGTAAQGSAYTHKHGGLTGSAGSETLTHSGVKDVADGTSTAPDCVLKHSLTVDGVSQSIGASATIEHVDSMGQFAIPEITQQVPNIDTEDGDPMLSEIPNEYFQLTGFGDVYLVWKVDLELEPPVQKCWVQVGDPSASPISSTGVDKTETNRLSETPVEGSTATEGTYSVKIGTVTEDNRIQQRVSGDVSWRPFVLDRTRT